MDIIECRSQLSEVGYALSYGRHAVFGEFVRAGCESGEHRLEVHVIKQGAVYDGACRRGEAGAAGDLSSVNQYIVMGSRHRLQPLGAQRAGDPIQEGRKHRFAMGTRRDKGDHQVTFVRIDTSSPALALHHCDAVFAAVRLIHLHRCFLMTAVDDRRGHHPSKEHRFCDALYQFLLLLQVFGQCQSFFKMNNRHLSPFTFHLSILGADISFPWQKRCVSCLSSPK